MIEYGEYDWLGYVLIAVLTGLPVAMMAIFYPEILFFIDPVSALTALAKITAFTGITLFAIDLLLSTRTHWIDRLFGGLDRVYHIHHYTGLGSFLLLVLHPVFLAFRLVFISPNAVILYFFPELDLGINLGKLGLYLMTGILVGSVYIKLPYQHTKRIHQVFGVVFILGAIHAILSGSVIAAVAPIRLYVLFLAVLAAVNYIHTTVFGNILFSKAVYLVSKVNRVNDQVTEIFMDPVSSPIQFKPGQFILIKYEKDGLREYHPFSIASASSDPTLCVAIKAMGDWTQQVSTVTPGTRAIIQGPYGGFSYQHTKLKQQIWIAGGIGITPFLSMIRSLQTEDNLTYQVDLYYSFKKSEDALFVEELQALAKQWSHFQLFLIATQTQGRINVMKINKLSNGLAGKEFLICGPKPKMDSLKHQLRSQGVHRDLIHTEEFKLL